MKALIALTVTTMVGFTSFASAGPISTLGGCYDHVVTACNQTAHPVPCANGGFDECDEEFSNSSAALKLKAKTARTRAERFVRTRANLKNSG
jgi:hypothetical protein